MLPLEQCTQTARAATNQLPPRPPLPLPQPAVEVFEAAVPPSQRPAVIQELSGGDHTRIKVGLWCVLGKPISGAGFWAERVHASSQSRQH